MVALGASLATFGIGAVFPLLMDGVISAAPADRAGSSAALASSPTSRATLCLTVLGSLGTVVYRARLGMPGSTAEQSVIDGLREGPRDPALLSAVRPSFTDAFHVAGLVGVLVMVGVLVLAARATRPARVPEQVAPVPPTGRRPRPRRGSPGSVALVAPGGIRRTRRLACLGRRLGPAPAHALPGGGHDQRAEDDPMMPLGLSASPSPDSRLITSPPMNEPIRPALKAIAQSMPARRCRGSAGRRTYQHAEQDDAEDEHGADGRPPDASGASPATGGRRSPARRPTAPYALLRSSGCASPAGWRRRRRGRGRRCGAGGSG